MPWPARPALPLCAACFLVVFALGATAVLGAAENADMMVPMQFRLLLGLALFVVTVLTGLVWLLHGAHRRQADLARQLADEVDQSRKLTRELDLFRRVVEHSPASIVITDTEGVIEYVNPQFCTLTGYAKEEVLGVNPRFLKAGSLPKEYYAAMWQELAAGRTWRGEFCNRKKNGEEYWESASISPVAGPSGVVRHYIAVKEDITLRKAMQDELLRKTGILQATLEHMQHAILMVDAAGQVMASNHRLEELFRVPKGSFAGDCDFEYVVRLAVESLGLGEEHVQQARLHAQRKVPYFFELDLPDGRSLEIRHNPLPGGGFVRTFTDITSRKQAELLREDMERISRHDLKTPLNGIIGLPQLLLEDDNLTPEQREVLEHVRQVGYRMLRSINLSLDLYKMETGSYQLAPAPVDLVRVVRDILRETRDKIEPAGVTVLVLLAGRPPGPEDRCYVWGEELLCYSMLANLLLNAVEASPPGSVVRVELCDSGQAQVRIHNQGEVPEAMRARFFEKYATHGKHQGTGLGTYSARLIARVQGGELTMHSSAAEGTTLSVRLPLVPEEAKPGAQA